MPSGTSTSATHYPNLYSLLDKFRDTIPDELPDVLPPLTDIQHAIYLVLGS